MKRKEMPSTREIFAICSRGFTGAGGSTEPSVSPFQALPYVALLIAMLFFIYAVIGMQVSSSHLQAPLCWVAPVCSKVHLCRVRWEDEVMSFLPNPLAVEEIGRWERCESAYARRDPGPEQHSKMGRWGGAALWNEWSARYPGKALVLNVHVGSLCV